LAKKGFGVQLLDSPGKGLGKDYWRQGIYRETLKFIKNTGGK